MTPEANSDKTYPLNKQKAEAIVVHCADPRFQSAFREFVHNRLGIANYIPLVVGGAIHPYGVENKMPANFEAVRYQLEFFIKETGVKDLVIINHEDCLWYKTLKQHYPDEDLVTKEKRDLTTAARRITGDFEGVKVRTFWAGLENDKISFTELTEE